MTTIVIDASAALAWVLVSQATPASRVFLSEAGDHVLVAPFIFGWEVKNVLLGALRTGRLSLETYEEAIDTLEEMDIRSGETFSEQHVELLAMSERLSLFDAAYLDMALETGAGLASRDRALLVACTRMGVPVFDLRASA